MSPDAIVILLLMSIFFGVVIFKQVLERKSENAKTITLSQEEILLKNLPFYSQLRSTDLKRFNHRVEMFLEFHEFHGREGLQINEEIMITIAGAAVHITFGLDDFLLGSFKEIYVYPSIFYSPFSKTMNKGETNPHGILAFSWPHFKEGFATTTDRINLGYHEFAHAIMLQNSMEELNDEQFNRGYQLFGVAMQHFKIARTAFELKFLRDYAFTNKMEFFAVCAEHFMEDPQELYDKFPGLYRLMVRMLRMDPLDNRLRIHFQYNDEPETDTVERLLYMTDYN